MELRWVKGTNEYLPEVQIMRERVLRTIREAFELFGFNPAETPMLHHREMLSSKYAGGAEILKEMMSIRESEFRGSKRDLCLRYDLTVPFSLLIGINQGSDLVMPFRRYEIGKVFRDGPVKRGRRVEFSQCDADVVGLKSMIADAELIAIADRVFKKLKIKACVEINHRKLLSAIIQESGIAKEKTSEVILSIDKFKKIDRKGVFDEIKEKGIDQKSCDRLLDFFGYMPDGISDTRKLLKQFKQDLNSDLAQEALSEFEDYLTYLEILNPELQILFMPSLARGLEIYTGPIFEFYLKDQNLTSSSIGSGGRYDRIIGQFLNPDKPQRHEEFPATGLSFGLEPLTVAMLEMQKQKKESVKKTSVKVLVAPMGTVKEALKVGSQLRAGGIRTEIAYQNSNLKKSMKLANRMNIPYVAILGESEIEKGVVMFRGMQDGQQEELTVEQIIERLRGSEK